MAYYGNNYYGQNPVSSSLYGSVGSTGGYFDPLSAISRGTQRRRMPPSGATQGGTVGAGGTVAPMTDGGGGVSSGSGVNVNVGTSTGGGGGWSPPADWGARNLWSEGSGEYDPSEFAWGGSTPQNWWRSPGMAGGVVYNDQYGWQLADPVRDWYRGFQAAPTAEQFGGAGFTPQGVGATDVGGWKQYYPDRDTDAGWYARGYEWDQAAGQWVYTGGGGLPGSTPTGPTPTDGGGTVSGGGVQGTGVPLPGQEEPGFLENFGYRGGLDLNPWETGALDFVSQIYGNQTPLNMMTQPTNYYSDVMSGMYAPMGQAITRAVYEPQKQEMLSNLEEGSQLLARRFANKGAFSGGEHIAAQQGLAKSMINPMNQTMADLLMQGYQSDIANRGSAASGMTGAASTARGMESSTLNDILTGGKLVSNRSLLNESLYQTASDKAYQDWLRAKQEQMSPLDYLLSSLGLSSGSRVPIVQQPQESAWGGILKALIGAGGAVAGALI